jgi:hypothetical protein
MSWRTSTTTARCPLARPGPCSCWARARCVWCLQESRLRLWCCWVSSRWRTQVPQAPSCQRQQPVMRAHDRLLHLFPSPLDTHTHTTHTHTRRNTQHPTVKEVLVTIKFVNGKPEGKHMEVRAFGGRCCRVCLDESSPVQPPAMRAGWAGAHSVHVCGESCSQLCSMLKASPRADTCVCRACRLSTSRAVRGPRCPTTSARRACSMTTGEACAVVARMQWCVRPSQLSRPLTN